MAFWTIRGLIAVATGVSATAVAARKALGNHVDGKTQAVIDRAVEDAREELRLEAKTWFSASFRRFLITVAAKVSLLLIVFSLYLTSVITLTIAAASFAVLLVLFSLYDFIRLIPTLRYIWNEVRIHGLRPKRIMAETVAAEVFERVLDQAKDAPVRRTESLVFLLAGKKRSEIVEQIAKGVSRLAAETSWSDVRPIAVDYVVRFVLLISLYSASVWTVIWMLR